MWTGALDLLVKTVLYGNIPRSYECSCELRFTGKNCEITAFSWTREITLSVASHRYFCDSPILNSIAKKR